jgi:hypothetical protein
MKENSTFWAIFLFLNSSTNLNFHLFFLDFVYWGHNPSNKTPANEIPDYHSTQVSNKKAIQFKTQLSSSPDRPNYLAVLVPFFVLSIFLSVVISVIPNQFPKPKKQLSSFPKIYKTNAKMATKQIVIEVVLYVLYDCRFL